MQTALFFGFRSWQILVAYYNGVVNWDGAADRLVLWHESTGYETIVDPGDEPVDRKRKRHAKHGNRVLDTRSAFLFTCMFLKFNVVRHIVNCHKPIGPTPVGVDHRSALEVCWPIDYLQSLCQTLDT